jgi:nitrite reductase [NAD(P)H] small subunit
MQSVSKKQTVNGDWLEVGSLSDIPRQGARVIKIADGDIAVFRTAEDKVFALRDKCPHKGGPLSQGIVHGNKVTCPLHDWRISLDTGIAVEPDEGCAASFPVRMEGEQIFLLLTPNEGHSNK